MKHLRYLVIFIYFLFSHLTFAQINLLWSESSSTTDLYRYSDGKIKYYCVMEASTMKVYNAADLQLAYTINIDPDDTPYQLIPDLNSNGHDEILFEGTNSGDDIVKIVDLGTQDLIYLWGETGSDYYFQDMHQAVDSDDLRVHIFKNVNGTVTESSVYSLGVSPSGNQQQPNEIPDEGFRLNQNYPNPFNSSTMISYNMDSPGEVTLKIFDVNGKLVREYSRSQNSGGTYYVHWNGRNNNGEKVASGIYLYAIENRGMSSSKKMILLK